MFYQGFAKIVFHHLCLNHSLSLTHTPTLPLKHKSTNSLIFQSFLSQLFSTWLHLLHRPLSFFLPGGKVSDESRAEKRALICINLWLISGEGARRREGGRERAPPPNSTPLSPLPQNSTITTTAAVQKQELSNQSNAPQRLVQSTQDLTQKLITSPSPTMDGTKPCMELSKEGHAEHSMHECTSPQLHSHTPSILHSSS